MPPTTSASTRKTAIVLNSRRRRSRCGARFGMPEVTRGVAWVAAAAARSVPRPGVAASAPVVAIIAVTGAFASGRPRRNRNRSARRSSADW